jgi:hypothetical protein
VSAHRAHAFALSLGLALSAVVACSDDASPRPSATSPLADAGAGDAAFDSGTQLRVVVPDTGRVFVSLGGAAIVPIAGDPTASREWDLAFEGFDVFTNSGPSGGGSASAFGPLDAIAFIGDTAPVTPFLTADKPGGAFLDWYDYAGAPSHALWSRFHVFGVKDGARLWKVQVLGYYGQRDGAPVSALYGLRYAELLATGPEPTKTLELLDGTAGGPSGGATAASECLDLGTDTRTMLSPAESLASSAWHLCFRRQSIIVNGERGGPRGAGAVDLSADTVATEPLADVMARTAASEQAKFDAVDAASFAGKIFRGDRIVSAFGDAWLDRTRSPITPANAAWVVLGADGKQKYLVGYRALEAPTERGPGTVVMQIKPVKG